MNSILDKMSLSDLNILKSALEKQLSIKEEYANAQRGHDLEEFNRRYLTFRNDEDHERLREVNRRIKDIIKFPVGHKSAKTFPSKGEVVDRGYNKALVSDYNQRKVLRDYDNDIYFSGWMDCYDWIVGQMSKTHFDEADQIKK